MLCNFNTSTLLFPTEVMRNPPGGISTFVQAFSQNGVGRCSRNSNTMCNFFTCHSAVYREDLGTRSTLLNQSTFGVFLTSGRSQCSNFPHETLSQAWNCTSVNSFQTTHFHQRTVDLRWSFPAQCFNLDVRALIVISHGTWDTNSCHLNDLSFSSAHTSGDKLQCTSCQTFSSRTAEMAAKIASLLSQCCKRMHFFWDHPRRIIWMTFSPIIYFLFWYVCCLWCSYLIAAQLCWVGWMEE